MILRFVTAFAFAIGLSAPAFAADQTDTAAPTTAAALPAPPRPDLVFTLRGGVSTKPEYFGSESQKIGPDFNFRLNFIQLGGYTYGDPEVTTAPRLFSIGPSFRYIRKRDSDDYGELDGLKKVDETLEIGLALGFARENFLAFGRVRRGFGGHEGWVAEAGADVLFRANDRLLLSLGPRVLFGDNTFTDTYFAVTGKESRDSKFSEYNPDSGLISAGLEFGARYRINDLWGIEGAVTYDVLQDDAADSPVVKQGTKNQWGARIGLTRVFRIGG